jgi:hypothetical protein
MWNAGARYLAFDTRRYIMIAGRARWCKAAVHGRLSCAGAAMTASRRPSRGMSMPLPLTAGEDGDCWHHTISPMSEAFAWVRRNHCPKKLQSYACEATVRFPS